MIRLFFLLITGSLVLAEVPHVEHPPFDGWYNNWAHPDWGAAETTLYRRLAPAYSDGVYEPAGAHRPNPFEISDAVFSGKTGHASVKNRSALLVFFGQQVVEEVLDAQRPGCPPEYFNIKIPKNHAQYDKDGRGGREMPFLRSRYDQNTGYSPHVPREQLNEISAFLDGGLVYGPNKAWADALRSYKGGRLAAYNDNDASKPNFPAENDIRLPMANPAPPFDHKLKPIKRFFKLGNPRGNENPFLLTFGVLLFRWHNHQAAQLQANHPDWSDERLFLEARKLVIAHHQKIVMYDWIPAWLGTEVSEYKGYNPSVHPGIAHVFQSAAMRFGHTLVPPAVYRRNRNCVFRNTSDISGFSGHSALRTCNTFWNSPVSLHQTDIDELLMGMASQITEREDNIVTPDLRGDVFGPLEFPRRDLMAVNIQRGRDHGLPDYNTARKLYGLKPITDWTDINPDFFTNSPDVCGPGVLEKIRNLYNNSLDDVDIWPAGLLETTANGPGELFRTIIKDQFERIRDGDRFWFENRDNGLYTDEEIDAINKTTLRDIIIAVTDIGENDLQENIFFVGDDVPCKQPDQLGDLMTTGSIGECKRPRDAPEVQDGVVFDYFWGSEVSYALTFIAYHSLLAVTVLVLILLARRRDKEVQKKMAMTREKTRKRTKVPSKQISVITASEWIGKKQGHRNVIIKLESSKKHILVTEASSRKSKVLRTIDLNLLLKNRQTGVELILSADGKMTMMALKVPKEYDLVLVFDDQRDRDQSQVELERFMFKAGLGRTLSTVPEKDLLRDAHSVQDRKSLLTQFFQTVLANAFHEEESENREDLDFVKAKEILETELTRYEFAEALSLKPDSLFVNSMFKLVDKNENGYISFREFLDFFVIFSKGNADDKVKLMFDMYDLDNTGTLTKEEFRTMLTSMVDLANEKVEEKDIETLIGSLFSSAGLEGKPAITFTDFKKILKNYESELNYTSLNLAGISPSEVYLYNNNDCAGTGVPMNAQPRRENASSRARRTVILSYDNLDLSSASTGRTANKENRRLSTIQEVKTIKKTAPKGKFALFCNDILRYFVNYKLHIFWCTLYTLITLGIFIERAYYYSIEREHAGLRRIAGYGVTVTRGAASGMMFTYASLLVTMCRNTVTFLRETFLHKYIPFDGAISFHKYIAYLALFFTLLHIIGHCINFYHISTQTPGDLICLFRNFFHATDDLPKFHRWCWNTLTGVTGVLLTINMFVIYVFAVQYARRHTFKAFWFTHNTYPIFFILMILHGAGRLVQPPFTHLFILGPVVLFTLDRLVSINRKKVEIAVITAELLPSDVTYLQFKRPLNFEYKSGQWCRIACLVQGSNEYHPFTLTSAPHEENLSLHIRAVGPWTMNLRRTYDPDHVGEHSWPKVFLDGPYGEGHQEWYRYEVAVLVGGGIGVTPFASILKDIKYKSRTNAQFVCKKVYFLWVTRTQRQFEWLTDIIREVEDSDLVSVHVFITQFKEKYDIRTTMLYICERYFQKISERSLFTGLRSITHFGRPEFKQFFQMLQVEHPNNSEFGVFSCGPPPMTSSVEKACAHVNKTSTNVLFQHHFENF
ncbi:hypothetical protein CAPTEDRAFT_159209 [Capitella teleta]|uniref:NAD(P)H oxidase (H2O2-forming) n=1 Tax=Capitella teleta TaxID=283909 RepID=R7UBM1_CAPTE|nr:hypothetical protein CAPTEDRAFT_159209 [Capitella teleta]|eukprot:ELU01203.1 hypothetical protein CAPTEDRAFT_159209 [Capitella teleta]